MFCMMFLYVITMCLLVWKKLTYVALIWRRDVQYQIQMMNVNVRWKHNGPFLVAYTISVADGRMLLRSCRCFFWTNFATSGNLYVLLSSVLCEVVPWVSDHWSKYCSVLGLEPVLHCNTLQFHSFTIHFAYYV